MISLKELIIGEVMVGFILFDAAENRWGGRRCRLCWQNMRMIRGRLGFKLTGVQ